MGMEAPSETTTEKGAGVPWLKPPWKKGQSGNPSGVPKNGKPRGPSPSELRKRFVEAWETGDVGQRFIARWLKDALSGPPSIRARAREQILERFWPAIQEAKNSQKTIQLGVRLELSPDSQTPTLTVVASETEALPSGSSSPAAVSSLPASLPFLDRQVEAAPAGQVATPSEMATLVAPPEKSAE